MKLSRPLTTFRNFRGLYSRDESGLVPSSPASGVFCSALQNVQCEDGTITFVKGYTKQTNAASATTTYALTDNTFARFAYSYKKMDGTNVVLLFLDNGKIMWFNSARNHYETLHTGLTTGLDYSAVAYLLASTNVFERSRVFFGNGTDNNMVWNAGTTTFASATAATITKQGTSTWADAGFEATGSVIINGTTYTYTGGTGTTTITGVAPDPTLAGHAVGSGIAQTVNTALATYSTTLKANIFFVYGGRLALSSTTTTQIKLSKVGDPTDFVTGGVGGTISVTIGDGAGPITAAAVYDDKVIVHKRNGVIFMSISQVDATTEITKIKPLVLRDSVGAASLHATAGAEDESYYVSSDLEFKAISRVLQDENSSPGSKSLSDSVDPTLRQLIADATSVIFHEKQCYASLRSGSVNDTVMQYDVTQRTFYFHKKAVGKWFTLDGELLFTSPTQIQVYKWSDSFEDDGGSVGYLWRGGRLNLEDEFRKKKLYVFASHMRMTQATVVSVQIDYNIDGALASYTFDVAGNGTSNSSGGYIISNQISATYGTNPYGLVPYGGNTSANSEDTDLVEIIVFHTLPGISPYDVTVQFSANNEGQRAKILSFGFLLDYRDETPKRAIV